LSVIFPVKIYKKANQVTEEPAPAE